MAKTKAFWEHVSEAVDPEVIGKLAALSVIEAPAVDAGYHYGARASNVTIPSDIQHKISCIVGGGRFSGFGRICKGFTEELGLPAKSYKIHHANILDLIDNLETVGKGKYEVIESIVLFDPIKFFVLLSNGNDEERLIYHYTNGRSNGTGRGFIVGPKSRQPVSACVISLDEHWRHVEQRRRWLLDEIEDEEAELADPMVGCDQDTVDKMVTYYNSLPNAKREAPWTAQRYLDNHRESVQNSLKMHQEMLGRLSKTRAECNASHALLEVL